MTSRFPRPRQGSPHNALFRVSARWAVTKPGSWVARKFAPMDRRILERTNAEHAPLGALRAPIILLTTKGRSSGQPRTQPLLYLHDGDTLYVIGSNYGGDRNPAWAMNLIAEPNATVTIAGQRIPVWASRVDGAEEESIFRRFVELWGAYATYRDRTSRDLPIFALTRT
ncbi:nitroreductase family deazaflavin-dependent oxidoreductase [Nocardia speluncae]|uniref:Nitroreductase family deazaflavin-dependent oxidoreductase n=1 Tax=Nocardia speluncae TaxID=419477 RepID=A0A846XQ69_9NOCA|nr:nitroreductase/quinone reductase family protein [Nocardia speluncae]NKY36860.1 nitroreductase family deazaflavin-dependent oxidoreductase [Nocardia speluncae]